MSRKPNIFGGFGELKQALGGRLRENGNSEGAAPPPDAPTTIGPISTDSPKTPGSVHTEVRTRSGKLIPVSTGKATLRVYPPAKGKLKPAPAGQDARLPTYPKPQKQVATARLPNAAPPAPHVTATRPAPTLVDVSADLARLAIRLPENRSVGRQRKKPSVLQDFLGKMFIARERKAASWTKSPAIIGFDFGTAFTKVVVQWRDRHYPVDWSSAGSLEHAYLMPSCFSEGRNGELVLGRKTGAGWKIIDGIKMKLISESPTAANLPSSSIDAVIFVALALRYVLAWFAEVAETQRGAFSASRLNFGLPAEPWEDEPLRELLSLIASSAFQLADSPTVITRQGAKAAFDEAGKTKSVTVSVVAEFAAQLASYMRGPRRENDIHGLIDIGAGTVDLVSFNAHVTRQKSLLPIASSRVEKLGSHYLLGALAGRKGQDLEWADSDAGESDVFFGTQTAESAAQVAARRQVFSEAFKVALNKLGNESYRWYPTSQRFKSDPKRLPVFLCGGGASIAQFRNILTSWQGLKLEILELPMPDGLEGDIAPDQFHRLSVAYGLSLLQRNLAEVWRKDMTTPMQQPREIDFGDRDADR